MTVCFLESGLSVERAQDLAVVSFHHESGGQERAPEDGFPVEVDGLFEGYVVLFCIGGLGAREGDFLDVMVVIAFVYLDRRVLLQVRNS